MRREDNEASTLDSKTIDEQRRKEQRNRKLVILEQDCTTKITVFKSSLSLISTASYVPFEVLYYIAHGFN